MAVTEEIVYGQGGEPLCSACISTLYSNIFFLVSLQEENLWQQTDEGYDLMPYSKTCQLEKLEKETTRFLWIPFLFCLIKNICITFFMLQLLLSYKYAKTKQSQYFKVSEANCEYAETMISSAVIKYWWIFFCRRMNISTLKR